FTYRRWKAERLREAVDSLARRDRFDQRAEPRAAIREEARVGASSPPASPAASTGDDRAAALRTDPMPSWVRDAPAPSWMRDEPVPSEELDDEPHWDREPLTELRDEVQR